MFTAFIRNNFKYRTQIVTGHDFYFKIKCRDYYCNTVIKDAYFLAIIAARKNRMPTVV